MKVSLQSPGDAPNFLPVEPGQPRAGGHRQQLKMARSLKQIWLETLIWRGFTAIAFTAG
jgi:hypothetical protein